MPKTYIKVTEEAGNHFFSKQHKTPVLMLNMLKFKETADYSSFPHLAPDSEITGKQAYKLYMKSVAPLLAKIGSRMTFSGKADRFLIGPSDEIWDAVILVKHLNMDDFLKFASDEDYLQIEGHRTAALEDSRLLPLLEGSLF